jgi:hypothetical protein
MQPWRTALLALAMNFSGSLQADDIVVTGRPLKQTAAELEECIKQHCSPDKDVSATLAHAENQFVSGDYSGSRTTLKKSLRRNRQHSESYPVPVSDLLRANGRIAEQVGEAKDYQLSMLDVRDTLKSAFGADDFRTLLAQIGVADSRAKLGFPDEAERGYRSVEQRALGLNQNRIVTLARLRQAVIVRARYEENPTTELRQQVDAMLNAVSLHPLAGAEDFAVVAEVMRARLDRKSGNVASTEAVIRAFARTGGADRPILLISEPLSRIDLTKDTGGDIQSTSAWQRYSTNGQGAWADVGFWVGADGHVGDIEVLRSNGSKDWLKPITENIAKRVYAPLKQGEGARPGFYMVERYTLTARFSDDVTGSHLRMRESVPRVEMIDLTPENFEAPAKKS